MKQWTVMLDGGDHDRRNLPGAEDLCTMATLAEAERERLMVATENRIPVEKYLILCRTVSAWQVAPTDA